MNNIYTIPLDNIDTKSMIMYFPKSMRFFVCDKTTIALYDKIDQGALYADICLQFPQITESDFLKAKELMEEKAISKTDIQKYKFNELPRLVINISNDCNLRCKYCYAHGGCYNSDRRQMSLSTLEKTLDSFLGYFDSIESIQLFGGEPTMNIPAIRFCCEYIRDHNYQSKVGMVTNGTMLDDAMLALIKEYDLGVTISIDVEQLHDKLRPFSGEQNSYNIIASNIKALKAMNIPLHEIELTYTKQHIDNGISVYDAIAEIQNRFSPAGVHVAPVSTNIKSLQLESPQSFIDAVDSMFSALKEDIQSSPFSMALSMLNTIKTRIANDYFCYAGFGTIAVSTSGEVYPCFYFCDNEEFVQCTVFDTQDNFDSKVKAMQEKYITALRAHDNSQCQNCFACTVCRGCLGNNFYGTGNTHQPTDFNCQLIQGMLERILKNVAAQSLFQKQGVNYEKSTNS